MDLYLKITVGLLLFVQVFHLAFLQDTTDSPGRTIDKSWLRDLPINTAESQKSTVNEEDISALDLSSGIASGSMGTFEDEQNLSSQDINETPDDLTVTSNTVAPIDTTNEIEFPSTTVSPATTTSVPTTTGQITTTNEDSTTTLQTSTTPLIAKTSTRFPVDFSSQSTLQSTTFAPQHNATQEPTTESQYRVNNTGLTNSTDLNSTMTATKTTTTEMNETSTTVSPTTVFSSEATETSTVTMKTTVVNTAVKFNLAYKDAASGSSPGRGSAGVSGFTPDSSRHEKFVAWATILGTAVAVTIVGLVAYIVLKNKRNKGFSHRKLVEEYPSDPVLRLDNNEPLDLNFGGSAYDNPGLQRDNIQMTNFPGCH